MASRNPIRDRVAIVGVGTTPYTRDRGQTPSALALEACSAAVRDAGLEAKDIDGLCGSSPRVECVAAGLGLPALTWWANLPIPSTAHVIEAMNAVHAGVCDSVLAYHATDRAASSPSPDTLGTVAGYADWASRYVREYGAKREHLGLVAINARSNAARNEHAALRDPLTTEAYLAGRMVRDPLTVFDMEYPVDGADAFVITTLERARDLPHEPVLIHAATLGTTRRPDEGEAPELRHHGQQVVAENLWRRSEVTLRDVDIFLPYDGSSVIALSWFEALGYCRYSEAGAFLEKSWDPSEKRIKIGGRILVNTHGGSLAEGGTQGSGQLREAVVQLRGEAGARQAPGVHTALVTTGGFCFDAGALILRTG